MEVQSIQQEKREVWVLLQFFPFLTVLQRGKCCD